MECSSPAFAYGERIPDRFTCAAENVNPPLSIGDVPDDARSLVLIVDDPDAPGGRWTHWTLWNIDPTRDIIHEGAVPEEAIEGATSFQTAGYGGPCPPPGTGDHRYFFHLYALDTTLDLSPSATSDEIAVAMSGHILENAEWMGTYSRS